jgi:uncharacterized membrane protein
VNLPHDITVDRVVEARASEGLSEETYSGLLDRFLKPPTTDAWRDTLRHWFLVGGILLLVSGIIYFGAFNWEHLGRLQKLGLLQAILVAFFSGVMLRGVESREGQVLLVAACAVVGGLLAVMGQVYQTGADSFLLFLGWAILILPWCVAGRMNVLWTSQMVLLDVTFTLWWFQTVSDDFTSYAPAFLVFNLVGFGLWEALRRRVTWMSTATSDLLMFAGLTPVTLAGCLAIVDDGNGAASLPCLALVLGALVYFRGKRLFSMATVSASLLCLGTTLIARICLEAGDEFGILMTGVGIMAQIALVIKWLTHIHKTSAPPPPPQVAEDLEGETSVEEFSLSEEEHNALVETGDLPWYVQTLVGAGAWFASLFVLVWFLLVVANSEGALTLFGCFLYGGTLFIRRRGKLPLFFHHALLSVHITGVMVTVFGMAEMTSEETIMGGLVGAVLLALSARYYEDRLGVFLFGFGFVGCGLASFAGMADDAGAVIWILLVMLSLFYFSAHLKRLLRSDLKRRVLPVTRGLTAGLLCSVMVLNFDQTIHPGMQLLLAVGAAAITLGMSRYLKHPLLAQLGLLVLGLVTYTVPALIVSVFVYLVGFQTRQKVIRGLGILAVAWSGSFFYYSLDLTLMTKSLVLVASGGALLLFRVLLGVRREEISEEDTYAL